MLQTSFVASGHHDRPDDEDGCPQRGREEPFVHSGMGEGPSAHDKGAICFDRWLYREQPHDTAQHAVHPLHWPHHPCGSNRRLGITNNTVIMMGIIVNHVDYGH